MKEQGGPDNESSDRGARSGAQSGAHGGVNPGEAGEFSAAMTRLEKAVQEIVTATTGQLTERATTLIDETSRRLEAELRWRRRAEGDEALERDRERRSRRRRYRHRLVDRAERVNPRSGRLYRDPRNQKIGGVCAGVARYFGFEPWTVRLAALTGLIFVPGVVFPAYWIAYFIMDKPAADDSIDADRRGRHSNRGRHAVKGNSPSELERRPPQRFVPSRSLRYTSADLTQAELRLRQLESFVTSDQYELHRELTKIEREAGQRNEG